MGRAPVGGEPADYPGPVLPGRLRPLPPAARVRQLFQAPAPGDQYQARDEYAALHQARKLQAIDGWKSRYKIRAGVEGTISRAVHVSRLRRSRYRGLAKTGLQHQLTGAAVNLIRIHAWLTHTRRARTRTSPLTALRPAA